MAMLWMAVLFITVTITTAAPVSDESCHARITQDPWPYIIGSGGALKLTCDVTNCNTTGARYFWDYTSGEERSCQEDNNALNTCTYQPTVEDAEKEVRCTLISPGNPVATLSLTIFYPPQEPPSIELADPNEHLNP